MPVTAKYFPAFNDLLYSRSPPANSPGTQIIVFQKRPQSHFRTLARHPCGAGFSARHRRLPVSVSNRPQAPYSQSTLSRQSYSASSGSRLSMNRLDYNRVAVSPGSPTSSKTPRLPPPIRASALNSRHLPLSVSSPVNDDVCRRGWSALNSRHPPSSVSSLYGPRRQSTRAVRVTVSTPRSTMGLRNPPLHEGRLSARRLREEPSLLPRTHPQPQPSKPLPRNWFRSADSAASPNLTCPRPLGYAGISR
jgi:hypothetical protein